MHWMVLHRPVELAALIGTWALVGIALEISFEWPATSPQ